MFSTARNHLQVLLSQSPGNAELLELLGRSQAAVGNDAEAAESFQQVIQLHSRAVGSISLFGGILRARLDRVKDADECMEKLTKADPDSCRAHLFAANYLNSTARSMRPPATRCGRWN